MDDLDFLYMQYGMAIENLKNVAAKRDFSSDGDAEFENAVEAVNNMRNLIWNTEAESAESAANTGTAIIDVETTATHISATLHGGDAAHAERWTAAINAFLATLSDKAAQNAN